MVQILSGTIFFNWFSFFFFRDAKGMGRDVTNLFVEMFEEYKNLSKMEAIKLLDELRKNKQFLEDVWT